MIKVGKIDVTVRFGQAVKKLRMELGLSQEVLAEKASLHRTYIADIERGKRNISLRNIEKIAGALSLKMADLMALVSKG
jgi:transcriptional regulator with XRE-family HTH domain